ncbi:pyocin activator PrtN family protein [Endozoicomonas lisbonensis]|uniref:Pyocin activator protein PrtN n=2 Tax=Endozoicomonas lisbonensis TaxID=3120522 RepID=A0ABV2SL87_9GAMM
MLDFDLLHREFGYRALVPLEDLVERGYLSLSVRTAKNRAALDLLPFPVVRPEDSQKSSYMVAINDFYKWINGRVKDANDSWQNMNG